MQAKRAQSSAWAIASFRMAGWYGEKKLVGNRHKYMAHSAKNFHKNSWQGEPYFQFPLKVDLCRNSMIFANFSFFLANFKNLHHDSVKVSNSQSTDSRKNLSFYEKLNLMKSGRFQWFKVGSVEN